ncbi:MFS transporter [Candidatus Woesearchaeota archaeon]|nr:MFS transporter [Candidatus Woesearchaeota archaeon]
MRYRKQLWPLYVSDIFLSISFYSPILILFLLSKSLSFQDIGFLSLGIYTTSLLLEFPTGIFADKYGRKSSLLISVFLSFISILIYISFTSYWLLFLGYILIGASWAFKSGAREALIYDTLKEKRLQRYNSKVLGELDFISSITIISAIIGPFIYNYSNILPFALDALIVGAGFFILFFLREPKYKKHSEEVPFYDSFKRGLKIILNNSTILSLFLLYLPLFFFEESWYITQQPLLISLGLPLMLLGFYSAFNSGIFAIGGIFLPKLLNIFSHRTLLFGVIILECIVWFVLGTNNLYAVIIFSSILLLMHQFWNYIDADIIHEHIPSNIRATTLSARQAIISFVWIFNPWFMGYLLDTFNRNYLFPIFGILILLIGIIVFISRRKYF